MELPAVAEPSWSRSETAQVIPQGTAPSIDTHPDNVSHRPGGRLDMTSLLWREKRSAAQTHNVPFGCRAQVHSPGHFSIHKAQKSWRTWRMSAAKQEPEARPKAPEKHFPEPSMQRHLCRELAAQHGGVVICPWVAVKR